MKFHSYCIWSSDIYFLIPFISGGGFLRSHGLCGRFNPGFSAFRSFGAPTSKHFPAAQVSTHVRVLVSVSISSDLYNDFFLINTYIYIYTPFIAGCCTKFLQQMSPRAPRFLQIFFRFWIACHASMLYTVAIAELMPQANIEIRDHHPVAPWLLCVVP